MGMLEAVNGLASVMGPAIGALMYSLSGYSGTFYIFGTFNICLATTLYFLFPKEKEIIASE
jgi:predicted MFS family arabinose efflux permease